MKESMPSSVQPAHAAQNPRFWLVVSRSVVAVMKLSVQRSLDSCPIDPLIPSILAALRTSRNVVIEAAPGAGKTTRVPPALLEFGPVLVLEPRRIAARLGARRVASELGEKVGETVGYQVRFEEISSARTRLRFLTEGMLARRMLSDPEL